MWSTATSPGFHKDLAIPDLELGLFERFCDQKGFLILGINLRAVEAAFVEDPVYIDIIESSSLLDLICFRSIITRPHHAVFLVYTRSIITVTLPFISESNA